MIFEPLVVDESTPSDSTSSRHSHRTAGSPDGEVLGASDSTITNAPNGEVLGASTSTMPVGAPNTGAGGTSASLTDSVATAVFTSNKITSKKKNG